MPVENWPSGLRGALTDTRRRVDAPAFLQSDPKVGPAYFEKKTSSPQSTVDFELRFSSPENIEFWIWFKSIIRSGVDWFNMPLEINGATADYLCHFVLPGPQMVSETGSGVHTYTASVVALDIYQRYPVCSTIGIDWGIIEAIESPANLQWPIIEAVDASLGVQWQIGTTDITGMGNDSERMGDPDALMGNYTVD